MATQPTQGHDVKLVYLTGTTAPSSSLSGFSADTIYVMPDKNAIYVGDTLIVDQFGGAVKGVTITGTGNNISDASFDNSTGTLTLTKSDLPTLSKGADTSGTATTLVGGGTFNAMTDTSVSGHEITDVVTTFTLPNIVGAVAKKASTEGTLEVTTNGTTTDVTVFADGTYMLATNGTATGATVTLAANPTADMQAATKKYVDDAVSGISGAMHFIGTTTTALTDGSTTNPITINGESVTAVAGDVVLYDGKEFVWDGSAWELLGDEGSYALKTVTVTAGTGLTGGGTLAADMTLSHQAAPSTGSAATATAGTAPSDLVAVTGVTIDSLGHVAGVTTGNFATAVDSAIDTKINALDYTDAVSGDYVTSVSEANGVISLTKGTKGSVASGDTGLVDGGTVYTAVEAAKLKWTVISGT